MTDFFAVSWALAPPPPPPPTGTSLFATSNFEYNSFAMSSLGDEKKMSKDAVVARIVYL